MNSEKWLKVTKTITYQQLRVRMATGYDTGHTDSVTELQGLSIDAEGGRTRSQVESPSTPASALLQGHGPSCRRRTRKFETVCKG